MVSDSWISRTNSILLRCDYINAIYSTIGGKAHDWTKPKQTAGRIKPNFFILRFTFNFCTGSTIFKLLFQLNNWEQSNGKHRTNSFMANCLSWWISCYRCIISIHLWIILWFRVISINP